MGKWRTMRVIAAGLLLFGLVTPSTAHAYLDSGTGSLIVQTVLAGIVGMATIAKLYWHKLRGLFSRERERDTSSRDGR